MYPQTIRSCFMLTNQTRLELIRVIQAAIFSLHSLGICVSGVFSATGSCANLRHALLLFAAARLMWWPCEPCSDGLAWLSASWLWAELSGDNVYQILRLSHTLHLRAAACRNTFQDAHECTRRPLFALNPNSKQFSNSLMLPNVFRWWRKSCQHAADITRRCWVMSSVFLGVWMEQTFFYPNFHFAMASRSFIYQMLQH